MIKRINFIALSALAIAIVTAMSCKKVLNKPDEGGSSNTIDTSNSTLIDRLYDSVFLYASQTYYWNTQLPNYMDFNPRQYKSSDTLNGLQMEVFKLSQYAINPDTKQPYEYPIDPADDPYDAKYSYLERTSDLVNGGSEYVKYNTPVSKAELMTLDGKNNDLGFIPGFITYGYQDNSKPDTTVAYVRYVTTNSPAYNAGLRRGMTIHKYNGDTLSYENDLDEILNLIEGNNITLSIYDSTLKKDVNYSFSKKLYDYNPIFKDTVLNIGTEKIGYIAYQTFSELENSEAPLDSAFKYFSNQSVKDIIVDLRYNGGGAVETAEHLVDLIAPVSAQNKKMYTAYYNSMMVNKQATILKYQPIPGEPGHTYFDYDYTPDGNSPDIQQVSGVPNLNLSHIYFIVSSRTASASELTINSLKPYFSDSVHLIGTNFSDDGKKTYGKPVGFFPIVIGNYTMYMPNFETKNAKDEGGYYQGMSTDIQPFDEIRRDFGDVREDALLATLQLINPQYKGLSDRQLNSANIISRTRIKALSVGKVTNMSNMIGKPKRILK